MICPCAKLARFASALALWGTRAVRGSQSSCSDAEPVWTAEAAGPGAQAQCILYRRYPGVLAPFKYAGYPLLLQAVTLPPDEDTSAAHFLAPERAPQLQASAALPFTCNTWLWVWSDMPAEANRTVLSYTVQG